MKKQRFFSFVILLALFTACEKQPMNKSTPSSAPALATISSEQQEAPERTATLETNQTLSTSNSHWIGKGHLLSTADLRSIVATAIEDVFTAFGTTKTGQTSVDDIKIQSVETICTIYDKVVLDYDGFQITYNKYYREDSPDEFQFVSFIVENDTQEFIKGLKIGMLDKDVLRYFYNENNAFADKLESSKSIIDVLKQSKDKDGFERIVLYNIKEPAVFANAPATGIVWKSEEMHESNMYEIIYDMHEGKEYIRLEILIVDEKVNSYSLKLN